MLVHFRCSAFVCGDTFGSLIDWGIFSEPFILAANLKTLAWHLWHVYFGYILVCRFSPIDNDWQGLAPVMLTLKSVLKSVCTLKHALVDNKENVKCQHGIHVMQRILYYIIIGCCGKSDIQGDTWDTHTSLFRSLCIAHHLWLSDFIWSNNHFFSMWLNEHFKIAF